MEWKKEKISAAELERSRKEYMSAAMSMMKRSSVTVQDAAAGDVPAADETPVQVQVQEISAEIVQTVGITQTEDEAQATERASAAGRRAGTG